MSTRVDNTTDQNYLEATLQELWRNVAVDSPNRQGDVCSVRIFNVSSQDERELTALVGQLLQNA
jgi:hypothetical protein